MNARERASVRVGRRIKVNIRGRRFWATVTGRSGVSLTLEPEQPRPGTKGWRVNYFSVTLDDVVQVDGQPAWSPADALKTSS